MSHIHDLIDFTIEAFIVYGGKVLLVHHKQHGKWLPVGGHIELDEDPEQALYREIKEETGLEPDEIEVLSERFATEDPDVKSLYSPAFLDIHKISDAHRHVGLGYIVKAKIDRLTLADGEHNEIRYFTLEELSDPGFAIPPNVQQYAKYALSEY